MEFPESIKYTKDHEWVKLEGDTATVGITAFAQKELGDIVFVDLPAPGKALKQGDTLCVVESTKAASDVYAPLSGKVAAVNDSLGSGPEKVNKEPYAGGWMVKLSGVNKSEYEGLLSVSQYRELIGEK